MSSIKCAGGVRNRTYASLACVICGTIMAAVLFGRGGSNNAAFAQDGISGGLTPPTWSAVGSSGTPDEASVEKVSFSSTQAGVKGSSGSVQLRYNFVPVNGFSEGLDGCEFWVRHRDNGSSARVRVWLKACNIVTGETVTLASFDSNDLPQTNEFQLNGLEVCGVTWDFYNFLYYLEAKLDKTSSGGNPGLGALQIAGISCQ